MTIPNQAIRLRLLATCFLLVTSAVAAGDEIESVTGIVEQVQLIDASSIGGDRELIIRLESGAAFRFPHVDHVAAGAGVKIRIRYRDENADGRLPAACSAQVIALPLDPDDSLREASRPFEVYLNPDCNVPGEDRN